MKLTASQKKSVPFQYANDVRSGKIITGNWIKLAVERFFSWIDSADSDGYYLDHDDAMRYINFFPKLLNHTKGKQAGQPFYLMPFQQFTAYNLFGWKSKKTGFRRINTVYDQRAKKNGKSAEMAGYGLELMVIDGEASAEIYVGATKEDQAKICWEQGRDFIISPLANPLLKQLGYKCLQKKILFPELLCKMVPLGGDSKTQDGINSHFSIIDEYHAHRDDSVKENLESSSVLRQQPITYHITTAGVNVSSVCKYYADMCKDVLLGIKTDNHLWIMIHELDKNDDWENESNWIKANPLLHQGLDIDNIRKEYIKAKNQISKVPNFKTKHLNMWVDAPEIWIPDEIWMATATDENYDHKFKELGCVSGTDLSATLDLTAESYLTYPDQDGKRYLKVHCYCPKMTIDVRSKADRVPYRQWMDQGWLTATDGNAVDYDIMEQNIKIRQEKYNVRNNEFDKWNATATINNLMKAGLPVSYYEQGIASMSAPTKEFLRLVYEGKIIHDGNPILRWALASAIVKPDPNRNLKVRKDLVHRNGRRVDPLVATIMALGGTMTPDDNSKESQYNDADEAYI